MKKLLPLVAFLSIQLFAAQNIAMYKSPTCGCCEKWADHMMQNEFSVKSIPTKDMSALKQRIPLPLNLRSCHTAFVEGYIIEGHVPAEAVAKLLREKPKDIAGLAVGGMPIGSPGMEQGNIKQPFDVIAFDKAGNQMVYASYR